jgi:PAS domain S-box-containing protein
MKPDNMNHSAPRSSPFNLESVLNAATEGILGVDQAGTYGFVSQSAAQILGHSSQELVGTDSHTMLHARAAGLILPGFWR